MKHIFSAFTLLAFLTMGHAIAGSGKAIVTHWSSNNSADHKHGLHISNISCNDVEVTITVYDETGSKVTSGISYTNFANSNTEIQANKTGIVTIDTSTWHYGYALIEWQNKGTDEDAVALVAYAHHIQKDGAVVEGYYGAPVNCGNPF